jgi:hypothetical protein
VLSTTAGGAFPGGDASSTPGLFFDSQSRKPAMTFDKYTEMWLGSVDTASSLLPVV